jgi:transcriptional regulator
MQTPEAKNIVMFQESLESKVQVPVDKSVDNIAAVPGQVEKAAEEQSTVQEIHEKIEGKGSTTWGVPNSR